MKEEDKIPFSSKGANHGGYNSLDDSLVWKAVKEKNDLEALACIYKRYYNGLYFYGLKSTPRSSAVEDSIQDLFLKLWDKRTRIHIKQEFKPYLFTMFRRILIDKLKQLNKSEEIKHSDDVLTPSISVQDIIIDKEIESEKLRQLDAALQGLPERHKEIIYLRFYVGLSYQQISDALGIKYQSIRNSVYESIKLLKKMITILVIASIFWLL